MILFSLGDFSRMFVVWLAARALGEVGGAATGMLSLAVPLYMMHNLASAAAAYLMGCLGDRRSRLPVLVAGYGLGVGPNLLLAAFSGTLAWLVLAILLSGVYNAGSFAEAIRMGIKTFHALKGLLKSKGYSTRVGDEGGFAPDLRSNVEAVEVILEAITRAGFRAGEDISICIDPATSEMWEDGTYSFVKSDRSKKTSGEMVALWPSWVGQYPIVLLEDGMAENDWTGWKTLTEELGKKVELVGDDLFCTNPAILAKGIEAAIGNSILIKLNQIGTLTETLDTIELARRHGYNCFISHRSGETEDTTIADLTVAKGAGHLKTGSGCRSERVAKFDRLLRIERHLGSAACFAGRGAFKC